MRAFTALGEEPLLLHNHGSELDVSWVREAYRLAGDADGEVVRRFVWSGDRSANKLASAEAALRLIVERLEGSA